MKMFKEFQDKCPWSRNEYSTPFRISIKQKPIGKTCAVGDDVLDCHDGECPFWTLYKLMAGK